MDEDRQVDELLQSAAEKWRNINDRPAPAVNRATLRAARPESAFASLARTAVAAGLIVVVAAAAAFALFLRPPDPTAVGRASPMSSGTALTVVSTQPPLMATPSPTSAPTTKPPTASSTARPAWTPPSLDEQNAEALRALDNWKAFLDRAPADLVLVAEGLTAQDHGWSGRNGDNAKSALGAGLIESEVGLPADIPAPALVTWPDGSTSTVELVSAADALDAIRSEGGGECAGCTPVHVTRVRLTTHEFDTTRGPTELPVWEFTLREGKVHVYRVAAANARSTLDDGGGSGIVSVSAAAGTKALTVKYMGGACTDPDRHTAHAVESDRAVVVFITSDEPPHSGPCITIGIIYTKTVELEQPLGSRTVLDLDGTPASRDVSWLEPR